MDYLDLSARGWIQKKSGAVTELEAAWISDPSGNGSPWILLMLGDYGTGKSSYTIHLAYGAA